MKRLVSYLRVSTDKQGASGLGLEAQRSLVARYASSDATIVAEYVEVESGRRKDRPKLIAALDHARCAQATLVVAKLDRLSRNLHFLTTLMESGVDFVACDNPHATRFTLHIFGALAEEEARMISDRTKAALAAARARGVKLGNPANLTADGRAAGIAAASRLRTEAASTAHASVVKLMHQLRLSGKSWREVAGELNGMGYVTRQRLPWTAATACAVYRRITALDRQTTRL